MQMSSADPHAGLFDVPLSRPMAQELTQSTGESPITWVKPQTWEEVPGSGMRLVSFFTDGADGRIEISIVTLSGAAGGLEANVRRWMGQVSIAELSDQKFSEFLAQSERFNTKANLSAIIIDLTKLQTSQSSQAPSIAAIVIDHPSTTIFIKMTGSKRDIEKNIQSLKNFAQDVSFKN